MGPKKGKYAPAQTEKPAPKEKSQGKKKEEAKHEESEEERPEGPKPKRGRSAYIFFSNEKRPEVNEKFPDLKAKEVMSKLGEMWSSCSEEDKEPYNDLAKKDKERYERQMGEYEDGGVFYDEDGHEVKEEKPKKRRSMSAKKPEPAKDMKRKAKTAGKKK